jgi:putative transposase
MNAYSVDLRHRIVAAVTSGMSRKDVIRTFQISAATLGRYLKQQRETGDLTPHRHTGGAQKQIGSEQHPALQELLAVSPDATLAEICQQWHQRTGVLVSQATMCRALATIGWTRKKRRSQQASVTKRNARPFGSKSYSTPPSSS